jgi:hypothetical protein
LIISKPIPEGLVAAPRHLPSRQQVAECVVAYLTPRNRHFGRRGIRRRGPAQEFAFDDSVRPQRSTRMPRKATGRPKKGGDASRIAADGSQLRAVASYRPSTVSLMWAVPCPVIPIAPAAAFERSMTRPAT